MSASTTRRCLALLALIGAVGCGGPRLKNPGASLLDSEGPYPAPLWMRDVGRALEASPVRVDGGWLVAPTGGALFRLEDRDGAERWSRKLPASLRGEPLVLGSRVIVATDAPSGKVLGIDLENGEERWTWERGITLPAGRDSMLVLAVRNRGVIRLDPETGEALWTVWHRGAGWRPVGVDPETGSILVPVRPDSVLALAPADGARLWARRVGSWPRIAFGPGRIHAVTDDSTLVELEATTGEVLRTVPLTAIAAGPAVEADGVLIVATRDGRVRAWTLDPWAPLWTTDLDAPLVSGPCLAGNEVIQGAPRGHLLILDRRTGEERMMMRHPELLMATPVATESTIAAGGHKGTLVLFGRTP